MTRVIFYSKSCEGCSGNHALDKMKQVCKKQGIDFQEHRTILWERYEEEANKIMKLNPGLELPFFFNEATQKVLHGNSFTPLEQIEKFAKEK